ncbi:MAG: potassium channel family protein [Bacteroidales bacterium]|nr:potassium channel family protein [Bacteroidales bacterium]
MNLFEKIDKKISPTSNLILLITVFFFVFATPFLPRSWHHTVNSVLFSLIFFISIFALNTGKKTMFLIACLAFVTEWITDWVEMPVLNYISMFVNIVYFQVIVVKLIIQIAKSKKADAGVIFESINGYLMLGMMFTVWVAVATRYDPAAFSFATENPTIQDYTYFTFVTITTLGYGDITPVLPFAKSIAILASTSGQIYVAVIIAMLVGKYAGSQNSE